MRDKRSRIIEFIKGTPIRYGASIVLDNLDSGKLVEGENGVCVENGYGTQFDLDELSLGELESFGLELGLEWRFDYLIVTSDNKWLSFGYFETDKVIQSELKELRAEANGEYSVYLFKANEFEKE